MQFLRGQIKKNKKTKKLRVRQVLKDLKKIGGLGVSPRLQCLLWVG